MNGIRQGQNERPGQPRGGGRQGGWEWHFLLVALPQTKCHQGRMKRDLKDESINKRATDLPREFAQD